MSIAPLASLPIVLEQLRALYEAEAGGAAA